MNSQKTFSDITQISEAFPGILLDAYGVFWGGNRVGLLPGAKEAMQALIAQGKIVGILSNSTQLSQKEMEKFHKSGLMQGEHFHFLLTSGDIAKRIFCHEGLPFPTPRKRYLLFSEPHPLFSSPYTLFQGSPYTETADSADADFIYISIPHINGEDQTDVAAFQEKVALLKKTGLPMVCANPDRFAHEGNPPKSVVRQGSIAGLYESLGGTVFYIGKPSPKAFSAALELFGKWNINKILMVGDTPETDIRGAKNSCIPSALLTKTGIMADRISLNGFQKVIQDLPFSDRPDFFIERLGKLS